MKNKALVGLIATATIGTAIAVPTVLNNQNTTHVVNKILMANNSATNEAVVVNGNSNMNLYALSNGTGIVSYLSTGEMLTIIGNQQGNYCKVKVQETGATGYINISNMQNILNGTNDSLIQLSKNGQVINVSSNVRLRSNPSINNNVITNLGNGTQLNILGKQGQWYKVNVNGQIGFIYEEYISINGSGQLSKTSTLNDQAPSSGASASSISSNSNNHVKNIIVRTKSSSNSQISTNVTGGNKGGNTKISSNDVTQINKTVKIYIPGTGSQGIGMTAKPLANNYSYFIPKGISTIRVISKNSYDTLSYIEYNGHYGYVSTSQIRICENDYLHRSEWEDTTGTKQVNNVKTNPNDVTQVNKTVKIYLLGKNFINMSKTATGNYYYKIPSGTSIIRIISENSNDGMSYIEYNGHYGYVNTTILNVGETNYNQIKNTNSSGHVKNIIVKTKSNKQSSSHIDNMQTGGVPGGENNTNSNQSNITQINKSVKVYVPVGGIKGLGLTSTPSAEKYFYFLPKGVSTVYVINENSSDGLSYIKYNGLFSTD